MDKPFRTFSEQVDILIERGIDVDCPEVLRHEGYYSVVNGYKDPFLQHPGRLCDDNNLYIDGVKLSHIKMLFDFDRDLRITSFRYAIRIEAVVKTLLAYHVEEVIAKRNIANAYFDDSIYYRPIPTKNQDRHQKHMDKVRDLKDVLRAIVNCERPFDKKDYLHHYQDKDRVPLWVVTNAMDFGKTIRMINLCSEGIQNKIAKSISEQYNDAYKCNEHFSFGFSAENSLYQKLVYIRTLRNICAHDERLYNTNFATKGKTQHVKVTYMDVVCDMKPFLDRDVYQAFNNEINNLLQHLQNELPEVVYKRVASWMGYTKASRSA